MSEIIEVHFHHGGNFTLDLIPKYVDEKDVMATNVEFDKDIILGLGENIEEPKESEDEADFEQVEARGSTSEVNVPHVEEVADIEAPINGLGREETDKSEINVADVEEVDVEDTDDEESDIDDDDSFLASSESYLDKIPDEDDSEAGEELIALRNERRTLLKRPTTKRKEPTVTAEVPLGEGKIDRGFEDIGKNKASKYARCLAGGEEYISSSADDYSEDSDEELDM
ncbi:hypothetical protein K7X08_027796 [Anisodus acutangulus]|uniref:Uncharacterized protein n=1 Tax=Anisodus acutangulus TaxID=402998 RepID=A0A9Q1LLK2_9SOLA|nr:hypothetical protein K7X08_027796 [Anisodus acutangulus]